MRVLLAHKFYETVGGAEVFFRETERALRLAGHQTEMIATGNASSTVPKDVHLLDAPNYKSGSFFKKALSLPTSIYDLNKQRQVAQIIERFKPDILHIFAINVHLTPAIVFAAKQAGVPVVVTMNDYKHICPNYKLYHHGKVCRDCEGEKFYNAIKNKCCKNEFGLSVASAMEAYVHRAIRYFDQIDHFTFSSDFIAQETQRFWPNRQISWSKLRNPFQSDAYEATAEYAQYGLYVGRVIEEKGVDKILQAAEAIDGFCIKIVGEGPDLDLLSRQAAQRGITNIEFLGAKWGDELELLIANARFVIVPSLWHENYPYVVIEAFAKGKPVIGSIRGGIPELVMDGETGLLFEPDDPVELATKIRFLAQNVDIARRLGRSAKAFADRQFTHELFLQELMQAYECALDAD